MSGVTTFEWPVNRDCFPPLPDLPPSPTPDQQAAYDAALAARDREADLAAYVLWALSGRQFGIRQVQVRPGRRHGWPCSPWIPVREFGEWTEASCGCTYSCTENTASRIHLPGPVFVDDDHPVTVTLHGGVLAPAGYAVEGDVLIRAEGEAWPSQNPARPLGEPGTWSVDYWMGWPVPNGVDQLTGALAKEFIAACDPTLQGQCRIPRTLVSTSGRGVSHNFDPSKILTERRTGLTEVDMWLMAVNPNRLTSNCEVL